MGYMPQNNNNAERLFKETVNERRQMSYGAKHKKIGTKSRKCGLPHDRMTKKEWIKMNGEVNTFAMNCPCKADHFIKQAPDIQLAYVEGLIDKFGIGCSRIALMMDTSRLNLSRLLDKIGYKRKHNHVPTDAQKADWDKWLKSFGWDAGYYNARPKKAMEPATTPVQPELTKQSAHVQVEHSTPDITIMVHDKYQLEEVIQLLNKMELKNPVDIVLTY